ncbi:MAG: protein TolQ [Candidatus Midichloria mitochondrii]|uniref:Tolq transport protein n=1 Tax=Midichloria mitochondrii (strain IricVA) TaxID=696127 RepID=F7XVX6_MIDMI|nr:protein TolQ [Candidatus Midichloria mitochondrii]AEI88825.1 Tolq transport protein [Candidatus Midichloria mitochondrii IricVA]MDJ1256480.1 protein TolQ [Candidatus Midichloria mitochondrii]MDJ1299079.1 protein TolQ [Candidatus Midichloria mitochondrii]MDJ1312978.1 protein TolQ [Candidatus Midichloria mitochondrii]MDJ1583803.1 protein TolQ [Candidatus Midichloria mitochondrii]
MLPIVAVPTAKIDSLTLPVDAAAAKSTLTSLSFFDLFLQADTVVKLVMLFLLVCSIISWTIIIDKIIVFMKLRYIMNNFEKNFWSGKPLDSLLRLVLQKKEKHPLSQVFVAAMQEIDLVNSSRLSFVKERLDQSMRTAINRAVEELEENIGFLATIASSAPFVGLFGTVWGIMSSFQSIAVSKSTTLAVVAPGIAEALLATAIGLIVAIPATIFYNKLSNDINKIVNKIENFSLELSTLIIRDIE